MTRTQILHARELLEQDRRHGDQGVVQRMAKLDQQRMQALGVGGTHEILALHFSIEARSEPRESHTKKIQL